MLDIDTVTEKTIVQQAAEWFGKHCDKLSDAFPTVRFRLADASDKINGKVNIELARKNIAASITFWNKGDVSALVMDTTSKEEKTLDDRRLTTQDEVALLLASYVEKVSAMSPSAPHV